MPAITYEQFEGGLDVRPSNLVTRSNILRVLSNAYITTGRSIRKRPCLSFVATLEAGTIGLKAGNGKLNTFYGHGTAITHANPLFRPNRAPHWTSGAAPTKIVTVEVFNALLYVVAEYAGPVYRHHYLDDPGTWLTLTAYGLGVYRRPTTPNGFRYEVTTSGTTAAGEPSWPLTVGTTVADGTVVWTCRTFAITDVNCPHSKQVTKRQQKIYAANGVNVSFCKTGDVRDWTAASDAGFLPAGLQASGDDTVTALGQFAANLAVFFSDSSQIWAVSSNPSNNVLTGSIENVGTNFHRSPRALAGDLFFLAQNGFRSMSLLALTDNLQDQDVGTAIDKLVTPAFVSTDDPLSIYYPKLGQWWCINGSTAWVYSFSRTSKLSAWSKFILPFVVDDATVLNQELYVRQGNDIYKVSDLVFKDGTSSTPLVEVEMYFQDAKTPTVLKQFMGMDLICTGQPTVKFRHAADAQTLLTTEYEYPAVTEPGVMYPVELCATRIAPIITHQKDEEFEMSLLSLLYENLGTV